METAHEAKLVPIPPKMQKRLGHGKLLIPRPLDVDAVIRKVPRGRVLTLSQLRQNLAKAAGADATCPLVSGMHVRIVAEAAAEDMKAGKSRVAPYWRVVRDDGRLLEKLPGGPVAQAERLEDEGHEIQYSAKLRVIF